VSSHSNSTIYDNRSYPQGPETGIITPNTIVAFRFCGKWVFEFPQKILEYLMEDQHQPILLYLCPGIVFQPHMTTGQTHRDLRQA
jgi:hypothetical protein